MNVSDFILNALKKIQRGTVDRKSSFRLPVFSTTINNSNNFKALCKKEKRAL